jgi:hypothetical protein
VILSLGLWVLDNLFIIMSGTDRKYLLKDSGIFCELMDILSKLLLAGNVLQEGYPCPWKSLVENQPLFIWLSCKISVPYSIFTSCTCSKMSIS